MSIKLDKVITELSGFTEDRMRKLAINITANLIIANPVATGFSRANWFMNSGVPLISNVAPSISAVGSQRDIQEATIAKIKLTYKLNQGAIFITNNVPYIGDLDAGTSAQAPSGFVRQSILSGIQQTK